MKTAFKIIAILIVLSITIFIFRAGGFSARTDYNLLNNGEPIVFAHRGHVDANVENSVESFNKSNSLGYNAIETDINCTKDGKLIVFHDDDCVRLLGIDKKISDMNWSELKDKNLIYAGKETNNKILSLDQFLQSIDASKIIYLDMKKSSDAIGDSLLNILAKNSDKGNIIVADADYMFLVSLRNKNSAISVCLEGFNKGKEFLYHIMPQKYKPDYYSSFLFQVDANHMEFLKKHKLIKQKITYGVEAKNINDAYKLGIKNIILDYDSSMVSVINIREKLLYL